MKNKPQLLLILGISITFLYNSCKKDNQNPIQALFSTGVWQLASVQVFHYTGNVLDSTDVLDTACNMTQLFTFTKNNTCTYTNFDCITQTSASASWSLAANKLYLMANVVCKDTTKAGTSMPFINAKIITLGRNSMVLQTGDIAPNYSLTAPRRIMEFGFVNQNALGAN